MPGPLQSQAHRDVAGLSHVVVCGGSAGEWTATEPAGWRSQLETFAESVHGMGVRWITVTPYDGEFAPPERQRVIENIVDVCGGQQRGDRVSFIAKDGLVVVVDVCADGREKFVRGVNDLKTSHINELDLAQALLPPGFAEPDLVLVFGSPTQVPPSLMWDLGYSELVFLDVSWRKCNAEHVQMAIDDFQRRDRRFGGVDS